jgi:hypothetical protein
MGLLTLHDFFWGGGGGVNEVRIMNKKKDTDVCTKVALYVA